MTPDEISAAFLQDNAAKHVLCLTYQLRQPGEAPVSQHATCFVVQVDEYWWLVTAGHVISRIREYAGADFRCNDFWLHDRLAGHHYEFGVPFVFDSDNWVVIDGAPAGTDYACAPIEDLTRAALQKGGVRAIERHSWGPPPLKDYVHWLLVGLPEETYVKTGETHLINLRLNPLKPCDSPPPGFIPSEFKVAASLVETLDKPLGNVIGMSGGPIFGIKIVDGAAKYWVIGIQSSWFEHARVVTFCPAIQFLEGLQEATNRARAIVAQGSTNVV